MKDTERATRAVATMVTQAMIDLYDEFTHVTLDRRDFMRRLTALAGSAAAAAAIAPMLAASGAKAAIVAADDARVKAETITYPGADGQTMTAISSCRPVLRGSCRRSWSCMRTAASTRISRMSRGGWRLKGFWRLPPIS